MRLLEKLLPESVAAAVAQPAMWETPLRAEEEQFILKARDKRKRDFRAGRHCARAALMALGCPEGVNIPVGEMRRPLWPGGFTGSISHTHGHCVAVAGASANYLSMGVDIEQAQPLGEDIVHMICTESERRSLSERPDPLKWAKLVFSIKEAIYKAHNPLCGVFIGFQDAEVLLDYDNGGFSATVNSKADSLAFRTSGKFATNSELVAAFVAVRSG